MAGVILNWSTTYPTAVDVTTAGGSMEEVTDGIHTVMASHPNSLAAAIVALETETVQLKQFAVNAPLEGENVGVSPQFIGAVKLPAGTSPMIRVLIGCIDVADSATLEIRAFTSGATISTLGGVAGGLAEHTDAIVAFPDPDWYGFYLYGNDAGAVSFCRGVNIEFVEV